MRSELLGAEDIEDDHSQDETTLRRGGIFGVGKGKGNMKCGGGEGEERLEIDFEGVVKRLGAG